MQTQLLIAGEWVDGSAGGRIDVENPATEDVVATVAAGTPVDAGRACDAAEAAQPGWAATAPRERGEVLGSSRQHQRHLYIRSGVGAKARYRRTTRRY